MAKRRKGKDIFENKNIKLKKGAKAKTLQGKNGKSFTGDFTEKSNSGKNEIRKAQRRLRNAPQFAKELAKEKGLDRLTTKGTLSDFTMNLRRAQAINNLDIMTKRGYNNWIRDLAQDTRLKPNQIEYALSQINLKRMSYIENSKLRYGSNPQLDYILDDMIEMRGRLEIALDEIEEFDEELPYDIF